MNRAGIAAWARHHGIPHTNSDAFPDPHRSIVQRRVRADEAVFEERPALRWFDRPMVPGEAGPDQELPASTWVRVFRVAPGLHGRAFYPHGRPS